MLGKFTHTHTHTIPTLPIPLPSLPTITPDRWNLELQYRFPTKHILRKSNAYFLSLPITSSCLCKCSCRSESESYSVKKKWEDVNSKYHSESIGIGDCHGLHFNWLGHKKDPWHSVRVRYISQGQLLHDDFQYDFVVLAFVWASASSWFWRVGSTSLSLCFYVFSFFVLLTGVQVWARTHFQFVSNETHGGGSS